MTGGIRRVGVLVGGIAVIVAAGALVWSAVATSSARVSATTETVGFFRSGTVELQQESSAQRFLFDADGLYPGSTIEGCVDIAYTGSLAGTMRAYATPAATTGLDRFVDMTLEVAPDCASDASGSVVFTGSLMDFWQTHDSFATGLTIEPRAQTGDTVGLRAVAVVRDDNRAQGRVVEFSMLVEVRP
ncbi:MAG: hypothetical protein ACE367_20220 [Acidimicrobiales bacterium]